jgi:hypothetical protein
MHLPAVHTDGHQIGLVVVEILSPPRLLYRRNLMASPKRPVAVTESADKPYGQVVMIAHHAMRADEAEALGGHDTGPSPYEYVMAGLGACTTMTLRMYADRHNWPLEKTSVEVRKALVKCPRKCRVRRA